MIGFFFFQAEDGIRDLTVTGVQTCALPIWQNDLWVSTIGRRRILDPNGPRTPWRGDGGLKDRDGDRKSTRLNSSHSQISYAVFCLKKKNRTHTGTAVTRTTQHRLHTTSLAC